MNKQTIAGLDNPVTQFNTGAVRDIQEDKGRMDLVPLAIVGELYTIYHNTFLTYSNRTETELIQEIFENLHNYIYEGDYTLLLKSLSNFIFISLEWCDHYESERVAYAILDVSLHYKQGLEKYGERNWEKGIPLHSYIDSGTRHFVKWLAHFKDERHDLAFIWNLLCCCHTQKYIDNKSLMDLPFCKEHKPLAPKTMKELANNVYQKLETLGWNTEDIKNESKNR